MKILGIVGSLRKNSFNRSLMNAFLAQKPEAVTMEIADISTLPFYNEDSESSFPESAQTLKTQIENADVVIIATPEYNRSVPGVLKNAIDWVSRPYGKNSFANKPVLAMGVSIGNIGTAVAQSHLRQIMIYLDADVIGQPELYLGPAQEIFDTEGNIINDSTKKLLARDRDRV